MPVMPRIARFHHIRTHRCYENVRFVRMMVVNRIKEVPCVPDRVPDNVLQFYALVEVYISFKFKVPAS
jgi:hypothetical protein